MERYVRGFLDLLTVTFMGRYRHRPLHLFGTLGLGLSVLAAVGQVDAGLRGAIARDLPKTAPAFFAMAMKGMTARRVSAEITMKAIWKSRSSSGEPVSESRTRPTRKRPGAVRSSSTYGRTRGFAQYGLPASWP